MFQIQSMVLLALETIALLTYIPGNLCIIIIKIRDWRRNKRLDVCNQLTIAVSGLNVLQGLLNMVSSLISILKMNNGFFRRIHYVVSLAASSCNLWFSTWICMYYCLRTVNIKISFYIYLQQLFPKMFPCLHILSVLMSLLVTIPSAWNSSESSSNTTLGTSCNNMSLSATPSDQRSWVITQVSFIIPSLGFLLMFSSSIAVLISLCVNLIKETQNAEKSGSHNSEARVCAAKMVSSIVGLNVVLFAAVNVIKSLPDNPVSTLAFSIAQIVIQILNCFNMLKGILKRKVNLREMSTKLCS